MFEEVSPLFTKYFHSTVLHINKDSALYPALLGGALEAVMGAFLWDNYRRDFWCHGMDCLQRLSYDLHLGVYQVTEEIRIRAVDEEFAERRQEFASPDEDKEHRVDLTPAEKTRVFRNAVSARNKVGWIFYDQTHRTDQIRMTRTSLSLVQKLFQHNLGTSPADLLKVLDHCVDAFRNQPKPPLDYKPGVRWHARTGGRDLWSFASYLKAIVRDLGVDSPVELFLGDISADQEELEMAA